MRTCLLVRDAERKPLCSIEGQKVYDALVTAQTKLAFSDFLPPLAGSGTQPSPFIINTFGHVNAYIERRNTKPEGTFYFNFCGVPMYQNGNKTSNQKDYYLGLVGEGSLSYPSMAGNLDQPTMNAPVATTQATTVKKAVGLSTANKYDVLALAALFIAEGRRSRLTLLTHLLLMDLIEDGVAYGEGQDKYRSIRRSVDISGVSKDKLKKYSTTNLGDSPMAHEGAVKDSHTSHQATKEGQSRYRDKTISIAVQWVAAYFSSPQFVLTPCKPEDVTPALTEQKLTSYADKIIDEKVQSDTIKKKGSEKASHFNRRVGALKEQERGKLDGVHNAIVEWIRTMFNVRLDYAKSDQSAAKNMGTMGETDASKLMAAVGS